MLGFDKAAKKGANNQDEWERQINAMMSDASLMFRHLRHNFDMSYPISF